MFTHFASENKLLDCFIIVARISRIIKSCGANIITSSLLQCAMIVCVITTHVKTAPNNKQLTNLAILQNKFCRSSKNDLATRSQDKVQNQGVCVMPMGWSVLDKY